MVGAITVENSYPFTVRPHSQSCGMGENASSKLCLPVTRLPIIGHGIAASWSAPDYTFLSVVVVWMPACFCRRSLYVTENSLGS